MLHVAGIPLISHFGNYLTESYAINQREDAVNYVESSAKVLEIGARFGAVSCVLNQKLDDKTKHVAFEPDDVVWETLERNRNFTNSEFSIIKGTLSKKPCNLTFRGGGILGGTKKYREDSRLSMTNRYHITYSEFVETYFIPTTLILDCEGAFDQIFKEFPDILEHVTTIIIEWDADDEKIVEYWKTIFTLKGFMEVKSGFHSVYKKSLNLKNVS